MVGISGELPLAPTLHLYANTTPPQMPTHHRMQITACKPHRVAVGASGSSPETHTMHPFPRRRHNYTTTGRYAGELPLAPTLHVYANTTPLQMPTHHCMQITACKPHRVAVGASGSSPETHTMHPFPRRRHNNTTTGRYAGELPLAPTLPLCGDVTQECITATR